MKPVHAYSSEMRVMVSDLNAAGGSVISEVGNHNRGCGI